MRQNTTRLAPSLDERANDSATGARTSTSIQSLTEGRSGGEDGERDARLARGNLFDAAYYRSGCGAIPYERSDRWLRFFEGVAEEIIRSLRPRRVLDAGCAMGLLVEALWDRGVEAWGVDISSHAISQVRRDMQPYCRVGSLAEPIEERYDLITCIEVLEHMPAEEALQAIEHMVRASDVILFSSTPNDFVEPTHINVRPTLYWLKSFRNFGFCPDLLYDASFVAPHALVLRRTPQAVAEEALVLFSEILRLKSALIERDKCIGKLTLDLQNASPQEAAEVEETPGASVGELQQVQLELERLAQIARDTADVSVRLRAERDALHARLAEINSSPGWRLLVRYRNWLDAGRSHGSWTVRLLDHGVTWALRKAQFGESAPQSNPIEIQAQLPPSDSAPRPAVVDPVFAYEKWLAATEPCPDELDLQRQLSKHLCLRPKISIVVPVFRVDLEIVRAMVDSVLAQTYDNWELCIAHAEPRADDVRDYLSNMCTSDDRIKLLLLETNLGISGNSNEAFCLSTGDFIALLDHDDMLTPFALFEVASLLNEQPDLDFLYSDKDMISEDGRRRHSPLFKPDWSPEIMMSANYLTHLTVIRSSQIRAVGGWRPETDGAQDWDLFLRVVERTDRVVHIPKILYHWREVTTSVASGGLEAKPYATEAQLRTIRSHFDRQGRKHDIALTPEGYFRIRWAVDVSEPVSVILVSEAGAPAERLAQDILAKSNYPNIEVVIEGSQPPHVSSLDARIRFVSTTTDGPLSARLNELVRCCSGCKCVFLDARLEIQSPDWLLELVGPLQDPSIGVVGPQFVHPKTGKFYQAGLVFNRGGEIARLFAGETPFCWNAFGAAGWYRNYLAVGGACFAVRRETFDRAGGFSDRPHFGRLDVDFCLKVGLGLDMRVLCNPFAVLRQSVEAAGEKHIEEATEPGYFASCFPAGDPYFNPNVACRSGEIALLPPATSDGTPAPGKDFAAESRILVQAFDFSSGDLGLSQQACSCPPQNKINHVTWFVPDFQNPAYGGIHTIFRFAEYFRKAHNVRSTFVVVGDCHPERVRRKVALVWPETAKASDFYVAKSYEELAQIPSSDVAIATLWTTAYFVLRHNRVRRKFYFVQDYEPLFYPAGSTSGLTEVTYRFGFCALSNTVSLLRLYESRGGQGECFTPRVDPSIFYCPNPDPRAGNAGGPYRVFCYARPEHQRNAFELLATALKKLKDRMKDDVSIYGAGADWDPASYGLAGVLRNLGVLGYRSTAALYRICHAGLSMMMTCHPSYLPLEMMACGCLVVSNRNPHTEWLLKDGVNCLLVDSAPSTIAEAVEDALRNSDLRERITAQAAEQMRAHADWAAEAERIYQFMRSRS